MQPPKNVLVTGAAGRVGSVVTEHLIASGFAVRATDVRFNPELSTRLDLADLTDSHIAYRLLDGVEAVVHLGNKPNSHSGTPQQVMNTNNTINTNVFIAAQELGIKRIVFASTIQTMLKPSVGHPRDDQPCRLPYLPADGDSPFFLENNYYALSKIFAEQMLAGLADADDQMVCTALRFPALPYGRWLEHLLRGKATWINPNEGFTYLPVPDAAALIEAILRKQTPGYRCYLPSQWFAFEGWSTRRLIDHYLPGVPSRDPGTKPDGIVDLSRLEADVGWKPSQPPIMFDAPPK